VARAESGDADGAWRLFHDEAAEHFGDAAGMSPAEFQARIFPSGAPPHSYFDRTPELFGVFVADMHRAVQRVDGYVRDNLSWCGSWDIDVTAVTTPVLLTYGLDDQMVPASHGEWLGARLPQAQLQLRAGGHGDITFGMAADAYAHLVRES
jgi:pimeloyl-ACP methyl ester carboxylesterase